MGRAPAADVQTGTVPTWTVRTPRTNRSGRRINPRGSPSSRSWRSVARSTSSRRSSAPASWRSNTPRTTRRVASVSGRWQVEEKRARRHLDEPGLGEQHIPSPAGAYRGIRRAHLAPEPGDLVRCEALLEARLSDPAIVGEEPVLESAFADGDPATWTDHRGEVGERRHLVVEVMDDGTGMNEVDGRPVEQRGRAADVRGRGVEREEVVTGPAGACRCARASNSALPSARTTVPAVPTVSASAAAMPPAPEPTSTATCPGCTPSHSTITRLRSVSRSSHAVSASAIFAQLTSSWTCRCRGAGSSAIRPACRARRGSAGGDLAQVAEPNGERGSERR